MKNAKKVVSLVLCLAMLGVMFTCVSLIPASAAAGDTWEEVYLNNTTWRYNLKSIDGVNNAARASSMISLTTSESPMYTVAAGTNSGTSFSDRYILVYKSGQTGMYLKPNTRYQLSFEVSAQGVSIDKYVAELTYFNFNAGTFPKTANNSLISDVHADLTPYATQTAWGDYLKYNVTLTYDTPASFSDAVPLLAMSVYHKPNQSKPIYIQHITFTEFGRYNVVDEDSGEILGTVYGVPGDDTTTLLEQGGGFEKWAYSMTAAPATIANDTQAIALSYTYDPQVIQSIDFGSGYGGGNPDWHYVSDSEAERHVWLEGGQIRHDDSDAVPNVNANNLIGQHSVTLANNYADSGLVAGGTYTLSFELSMNAAELQPQDLTADIRFGSHIWDENIITDKTIRYSGSTLAAMVIGQFNAGYGLTGYTFSMEVTLPETGWTGTLRNILLSVYGGAYRLDNVTITTAKKPTIAFASHSLVLAEEIGLNFFMDLSALTEEEKADSYMTFVISHDKTVYRRNFDSDFVNSTGVYYGFTCYLSSMEMAESVLPTFHYGDGQTVTGTPYSVKQYIDYVANHAGSFNGSVVTLVKALGDYGHYMQIYLGDKNDWTAGNQYTEMPQYRDTDYTSEMHAAYASNLAGKALVKNIAGSTVTRVTYNLNFDTITYVNVKITASSAITASAVVNRQRINAEDAGSYYLLRTQGLPITKLGDKFTITGSDGANSFTVTLSGLSYIRSMLNQVSETYTGTKDAMASLYDYYNAAMDFITYNDSLSGEFVDE